MANRSIVPDGGWGWVVVMAAAVNNMLSIPILQGFALIYKDRFKNLEISATEITTIVNCNSFFGMVLGIFNGPLITTFGFRKTAILGTLVFTSGVVLTSFASTFVQFIISYGMITSLGMGIAMSSFFIALNTYFLEKRGQAMAIGMTLTGIGPILFPQLIGLLLYVYAAPGTMLILGGCSLHALIGALLLHPVKWHARKEIMNFEKGEILETQSTSLLKEICPECSEDGQNKNWNSLPRKESAYELPVLDLAQTVNLGSSFNVFEESESVDDKQDIPLNVLTSVRGINHIEEMTCEKCGKFFLPESSPNVENTELKVGKKKTRLQKIVYAFGFDLLRDFIFVNITLGLSLAVFAENNFSALLPLILKEMRLTTKNITTVMSLLGSMDLLLRGISPFIGERLKKSPRTMYLFSLILLIIGRTLLMFTSNFVSLLLVIIWLGFAKGIRSVYSALVIPNYVPLERLPSASSLQQIFIGFFSMGVGPIIGFIRDSTGSYILGITFINCISGISICMWMIEMFIVSRKRKSQPNR